VDVASVNTARQQPSLFKLGGCGVAHAGGGCSMFIGGVNTIVGDVNMFVGAI
jgi:hypothetical protein